MGKRRKFTDQFKAKVALEVLRRDKTIQEIAARHQIQLLPGSACRHARKGRPGRVVDKQAVEGLADVFAHSGLVRTLIPTLSRQVFQSDWDKDSGASGQAAATSVERSFSGVVSRSF